MRIPRDALVVLIGPAGCGKSTWAHRYFHESEVVSSDECRRLVSDDESHQWASRQAFEVFHTIIRGRLSLARLTVADATNLRRRARTELRGYAAKFNRPTVAVAFDLPLELCHERARGRSRVVAPDVIERQYALLQLVLSKLEEEGFAAVYRVDGNSP